MAWLERHPTSGHFHLCFRWNGKRKRRSLSTDDTKAAEAIRLRFEENVALLERGRLELPPAADIMTFLLSVYQSAAGITFWVLTEADRSVTTVLLPDDY